MGDLVDAAPGACAQFVQSLGLPELKAKRLLAALGGGAAQGQVLPCHRQRASTTLVSTPITPHRLGLIRRHWADGSGPV